MANKRHKPEEIVQKLRQVDVLVGQGMQRVDAIREVRVTEQTYYRWRKQYGGMGTDQLKELKRLQKENERLRKAVSDLTLDKLILKEAARGAEGQRSATSEPRSSPRLHRAYPKRDEGVGAPDLPGAGAASINAKASATRPRRRRSACGRHDRTGQAIRQLWIPSRCGSAEGRRLAGQRWPDRTAVATRGAEGSTETTEEGTALAE